MAVKSLENLLNPNKDGELGDVIRRAREMGELVDALRSSLPEQDAAGIIAANIRDDGELIVMCSSSAWASRLRFASEALMQAARGTGAQANRCTVRVGRGHQ